MPRLATAQHNQHPNHCERYHYSDGNDGHHVFATTYDNDGHHVFATTYDEHMKNVQAYESATGTNGNATQTQ